MYREEHQDHEGAVDKAVVALDDLDCVLLAVVLDEGASGLLGEVAEDFDAVYCAVIH